jgi:hypothetical protein
VTRSEWFSRTVAGFVLAMLFCAMPFTDLGAGEPWYFCVASGIIAFAVGRAMSWLLVSVWRSL